MRNPNKLNFILDVVMFLVITALALTPGNEAHEILGVILVISVITHLVLHRKQIKILYNHLIPNPRTQIIGIILFLLVTASLFTLPFVLSKEHHGPRGHRGANSTQVE